MNDDTDVAESLSRFIAGLIGPVLLAVSASLLVNHSLASEIAGEVAHSKGLMLMSGASLLVAGLAIVQCHAAWHGWPAIVTVIGWLSVISGLARILFPVELAHIASSLSSPSIEIAIALTCCALGGYLTAKAYL